MPTFNGKVADDIVKIKDHQVQNGWGSAPAPNLFSHVCIIIGDDIFMIHRNLWSNPRLSKIGGDDIVSFSKKAIRNLLRANIDAHSRILIAEFPAYGIKCIEKLQLHCAKMTFANKSRHDRTFQQFTHKQV